MTLSSPDRPTVSPVFRVCPGETGHTSGGQARGRNNNTSEGDAADLLRETNKINENKINKYNKEY